MPSHCASLLVSILPIAQMIRLIPATSPMATHQCSLGTNCGRKELSSILYPGSFLLRASQYMQIVDDRTSAQIEEILAHTSIASMASLPPANMGKGMLNGHPFTEFSPSLWRLLALT